MVTTVKRAPPSGLSARFTQLRQPLSCVSDDLFDRNAIGRVVDANPPCIRAWAHGRWCSDLPAPTRFNG